MELNASQQQVVADNLGLASSYVDSFLTAGGGSLSHERDDLISEAYLGLCDAAASHEEEKSSFSNWAYWNIRRRIMSYNPALVRIPNRLRYGHDTRVSTVSDTSMDDGSYDEPAAKARRVLKNVLDYAEFWASTPGLSAEEQSRRKVAVVSLAMKGKGYSFPEISEKIGGVSQSHVKRAFYELREELQRVFPEGEV